MSTPFPYLPLPSLTREKGDNKEVVEKLKEQLAKEKKAKEQAKAAFEAAKARKREAEALKESSAVEQADGGESSRKKAKHKDSRRANK